MSSREHICARMEPSMAIQKTAAFGGPAGRAGQRKCFKCHSILDAHSEAGGRRAWLSGAAEGGEGLCGSPGS